MLPTSEGCVLDVKNLRVSYQTSGGQVRASQRCGFFLKPGERLGLVGNLDQARRRWPST
ncbi:MAG: hypothetical protein R2856_22400 [Caldilineaceae bacterium]